MDRADRRAVWRVALLPVLLASVASAQPSGAGAASIAALDDGQRAALQRSHEAWEALPEPMRRERRELWQAWQALPVGERERMRRARAAYLERPVAEQQALRARFDALDAGLRRGWLLGPVLGQDWPRLHALFAQVPPLERDALLEALRALSSQARDDLAVLAQRTPPQEREALRKALLAEPPAARENWLRRRVAP